MGVNLIKAPYTHVLKTRQNPLKNEGQERKTVLFGNGQQYEGAGQKDRKHKGKYGGCILYSCIKIEQ
jgi:hypothetical protein